MFGFYGIDMTYIIYVMPALIFAMYAQSKVNTTFNKFRNVANRRGYTGAEIARRILDMNGLNHIIIERIAGNLTDHFDPKTNVIRLSDSVHNSASTAAIGVACHEAGHAVQYAQSYFPIKLRAAIIPITNIGTKIAMPLILLGIVLSYLGEFSYFFVYLGIACFSLSLVFQLITLPVEFNASQRALNAIDACDILTEDERKGAKKTLSAAAMTYVAAAAVSMAQLLRLILLFGRRRND